MDVCVECRWCELSEDARRRLGYRCRKQDRSLRWDVIRKKACESFEPPPPAPYWGP